ncbi:MAG: hypothetical protein NTV04_07885 [Deltaproteobacteria bacterium]|nr:hypothetical protein [Deltaproteobacteria bacterium]
MVAFAIFPTGVFHSAPPLHSSPSIGDAARSTRQTWEFPFLKISTVLEGKKVFWYQDIILIDSELLAARTFGFEKTKTFSLQV